MLALLRGLTLLLMPIAVLVSGYSAVFGALSFSTDRVDSHIVGFGFWVMILSIVMFVLLVQKSVVPKQIYILTTAYIFTLGIGFSRLIHLSAQAEAGSYRHMGLGLSYAESLQGYLVWIFPAIAIIAVLVLLCISIASNDAQR